MAMETRTILTESAHGVATLTLNRPEVRNALDMTMRRDLEAALSELDADTGVRVVVVRGAGEHFCAGGDVKVMRDNPMTAAEGQSRVEAINRAILALARFRAPTIAMVDGVAVGAGCNLALACDLVVASDRARFGEVFVKIALVPDGGGHQIAPQRQVAAGPDGEAVDHRQRGLGEVEQPQHQAVEPLDPGPSLGGRHPLDHGLDVAAGAEVAAGAGEDHRADGGVGLELVERRHQLVAHGHVERVARLRAIQRDGGERPVAVHPQRLVPHGVLPAAG